MKLTIPFNGDLELINRVKRYPSVVEIYGKKTADFVGGGKHSFQTPFISRKKISRAISAAHDAGIKFNYLLNSSCLDNAEWRAGGNKKIVKLLKWLINEEVDSVTVALPYVMEIIKNRYPQLPVNISTLAAVSTPEKARYWEKMGAARITLLKLDVNRDFETLQRIRKRLNCELNLIVNVNCLWGCPFYGSHANASSHASKSCDAMKGFVIDYCRIKCRYLQLVDPVKFVSSSWIRPEDLHHYENTGINSFKIIDRGMTTETIVSIVKAYCERNYSGNLLELFPNPAASIAFKKLSLITKAKYFLRPFKVNVFKMLKFGKLLNNTVYIDNKKLEGFIEGMKEIDCRITPCEQCAYCEKYFHKAVTVNEEEASQLRKNYESCLKEIISGNLFRY